MQLHVGIISNARERNSCRLYRHELKGRLEPDAEERLTTTWFIGIPVLAYFSVDIGTNV